MCPLNMKEPIHSAVLKAVKRASTGFAVETSNSSGAYRMTDEGNVFASQILVSQHQGVKQQKQTNHGVGHKMFKLWFIVKEVVGIQNSVIF
jgi:hypothetical protein